MTLIEFTPQCLQQYELLFNLIFFISSFLVFYFSYKIHKKTNSNNIKFFSYSFLFIATSYFIQLILIIYKNFIENSNYCYHFILSNILIANNLITLFHIIFMTLGLSMLVFATFKEKNIKLLLLILILAFANIFLNPNPLYNFYLTSSIFLGFVSYNYIANYYKKKSINSLITGIAFILLFFGSVHFLTNVNHIMFYTYGLIFELLAYSLILFSLFRVFKR